MLYESLKLVRDDKAGCWKGMFEFWYEGYVYPFYCTCGPVSQTAEEAMKTLCDIAPLHDIRTMFLAAVDRTTEPMQ